MSTPQDLASLSREELLTLVSQLRELAIELQRQLAASTTTIQELRSEIAQLEQSSKREAAPFSKGTQTQQPKRPGRKPGEGTFSFRQTPRPEEITELPVNVPVIQESCPVCGGELAEERVDPSASSATVLNVQGFWRWPAKVRDA